VAALLRPSLLAQGCVVDLWRVRRAVQKIYGNTT